MIRYANSIHHKYIVSDAELRVELPPEIVKDVEISLKEGQYSREMFNDAQKAIHRVLATDVFPRFFYSGPGRKYLSLVSEVQKKKKKKNSRLQMVKTIAGKKKMKRKEKKKKKKKKTK